MSVIDEGPLGRDPGSHDPAWPPGGDAGSHDPACPPGEDPGSHDPAWLGRLRRSASLVSGLMFAAVFCVFIYKIAMRYVSHDEPAWTDEISVVLFVWIIFWASALVVRDRDQITFDLAYHPMPAPVRRGMAIARLVLVGGLFAWALPGSLDYIAFLWRERTPVLGLRLDVVYSCFGLFMIAVVVRSAWGLMRLLGPRWRAFI